jgi:hypothetical protein
MNVAAHISSHAAAARSEWVVFICKKLKSDLIKKSIHGILNSEHMFAIYRVRCHNGSEIRRAA